MTMIPFGEWRPDMPALSSWAREALNVIPFEESYAPLGQLTAVSSALAARCQGAAWFRSTGGGVKMFAADATKLYLLSGTTWTPVPALAAAKVITGITQANPGVVTTSTAHGYSNGDVVYLAAIVGMIQLNATFVTVTSTGANTFSIGVDTTGFTAYSSAGTAQKTTIYAPGADGVWRFTQFGTLAIGVNGVDVAVKFDLSSGSNFTPLLGSPPIGKYVATVKNTVFIANIGSTPQRVQYSGLDNSEVWGSSAALQSGFQDLPDGGDITGLIGGEIGVILQENAVRRATYEAPPVVWRLDKISNDIGCTIPGSVAAAINMGFFVHKSGFYMVQSGQVLTPIGRGKVDRTFWAEVDQTNFPRYSSTIDPVRGLYVFAYAANGNAGVPNRLLIFNWTTGRWSRVFVTVEVIFGGVSQQSYNIEQLAPFGDLDHLPYSLDSSFWSGVISLLLFAFDGNHKSGAFDGAAMEATVQTPEFNPGQGKRTVIRSCRPIIDGGAPIITVGFRETQQLPVTWSHYPVGLTSAGMAPVYESGRYFRIEAKLAAGSTWSNMQGIDDLDVQPDGEQ